MEEKKGKRSFADYTPDELRELSRRGGVRSGESRQQRKKLREELEALLSSGDMQQKVCGALIQKALNGNTFAFMTLRDTIGESPKKEMDLNIGSDLQSFRERHMDAIKRLFLDEVERGQPRYGTLSRDLLNYDEIRELMTEETETNEV